MSHVSFESPAHPQHVTAISKPSRLGQQQQQRTAAAATKAAQYTGTRNKKRRRMRKGSKRLVDNIQRFYEEASRAQQQEHQLDTEGWSTVLLAKHATHYWCRIVKESYQCSAALLAYCPSPVWGGSLLRLIVLHDALCNLSASAGPPENAWLRIKLLRAAA
jgi:hypothetical protein